MGDNAIAPDSTLGIHLIIEFFGAGHLQDGPPILTAMRGAAAAAGAQVLNANMHDFGDGQGVTGVVMLAESHMSIHTWPEHGYAAIDVFMCGDTAKPEICLDHLRAFFQPEREDVRRLQRGEASAFAQGQGHGAKYLKQKLG